MNNQLALLQLADSFFPSGSFTLSHGLESLVRQKQITNAEEFATFLEILLANKIGSCDLVALIHAYRGSQDNNFALIQLADEQLYCQTPIELNRQIQQKSGRALLMVAEETWDSPQLKLLQTKTAAKEIHCLHPIIFAVVAQTAGIDCRNTAIGFLHSYVTGLLGAAIRLNVIGHLQGQKILLALSNDIEFAYEKARCLSLDEMWTCTPTIDLAQMQHQKLKMRLFAS